MGRTIFTVRSRNKYGFTVAELLIVVAIITVLVGISIPLFTTQKQKAIATNNSANIRSGRSACTGILIESNTVCEYDIKSGTAKEADISSINIVPEVVDSEVYTSSVFVWLEDGAVKTKPSLSYTVSNHAERENNKNEGNTFLTPSGDVIILTNKEA